jgi:hypothetical protein
MNELNMRCVESDPGDQRLEGFRRVVFPVADDRMADGGELRPDLILQSSHQRDPRHGRGGEKALDGVSKLSPRRFPVSGCAQRLEHSLAAEIVDKGSLPCLEPPANHGQVLPNGGMGEELPNQHFTVALGLGKEQNAGAETIDAVDHQSSPPVPRQCGSQHRHGGGSMGAWNRNGRQAGWLIDYHHGIVLVKHEDLRLGWTAGSW